MKDKILQISLAQFLKYGIRKMSIQKLIAPLNISTKTFYKHFKNKEELLENALQLFYSQQYVMLKNLDAKQSAACLFFDIWYGAFELEYEARKEFFHDLHHYYPDLGKRIDKKNSKTFWNKLIQILHRGIEEGAFRKDIIPEAVLEGSGVLGLAIVREEKFKKSNGFIVCHVDDYWSTIRARDLSGVSF